MLFLANMIAEKRERSLNVAEGRERSRKARVGVGMVTWYIHVLIARAILRLFGWD